MPFEPKYEITATIASVLMRIEAVRQSIADLPVTPSVLASLRESARLHSTHYSTMIEGNRLTQEEVGRVVSKDAHFPGRERDEKEVLGYYAALEQVERLAASGVPAGEDRVRMIHALVMAGGRKGRLKPTAYREGQNVIRDSRTRAIVYLPPEAKDVPVLMREFTEWIRVSSKSVLPCPIRAAIAHYQFATIHPYCDGNGRTARLLTTLILHLGNYDLKGFYSLEEYYARNLTAYYEAIFIGPSHNYYLGRAEADITRWVEYFCSGMVESFESVKRQALAAAGAGASDMSELLRALEPRERRMLDVLRGKAAITSSDLESLFGLSQRAARNVLLAAVDHGFLVVVDSSKRGRKYGISTRFEALVK